MLLPAESRIMSVTKMGQSIPNIVAGSKLQVHQHCGALIDISLDTSLNVPCVNLN